MMITPTNTLTAEWQNGNSLRAYPISDDAPAASVIPAWLISDVSITMPSTLTQAFVSSAYVSGTLLSVGISARYANGGTVGLLACTVARDGLIPGRPYAMDSFGKASGTMSFGEPPVDAELGNWRFGADEAPLVASAVTRIMSPGVTGIVDPAHGTRADGIIDLSGNSEFRTYRVPGTSKVVVTLADSYRDLTTSVCNRTPSLDSCGGTPVATINGVPPDPSGNITIRFR